MLMFDALIGAVLVGVAWAFGVVPGVPHPSRTVMLLVVTGAALAIVALTMLRSSRARLLEGAAVLRMPRLYFGRVVPAQLGAWACRVGVSFTLVAVFGLPATLPLAALVVVARGVSTVAPATPGGAGAQQLRSCTPSRTLPVPPPPSPLRSACRSASPPSTRCSLLRASRSCSAPLRPSAMRAALRASGD
jgi:hypothetical protein